MKKVYLLSVSSKLSGYGFSRAFGWLAQHLICIVVHLAK